MKNKLFLIIFIASLLSSCMKENISVAQYGKVTELFSIPAINAAGSSDGKYIAGICYDNDSVIPQWSYVRLYDGNTGQKIEDIISKKIVNINTDQFNGIDISPDGKYIATLWQYDSSGTSNQILYIYSVTNNQLVTSINIANNYYLNFVNNFTYFKFNSNSDKLYFSNQQNVFHFYDLIKSSQDSIIINNMPVWREFYFTDNDKYMFFDNPLYILLSDPQKTVNQIPDATHICLYPNGEKAITINNNQISVYDITNKKYISTFYETQGFGFWRISISPDGKYFGIGNEEILNSSSEEGYSGPEIYSAVDGRFIVNVRSYPTNDLKFMTNNKIIVNGSTIYQISE